MINRIQRYKEIYRSNDFNGSMQNERNDEIKIKISWGFYNVFIKVLLLQNYKFVFIGVKRYIQMYSARSVKALQRLAVT